MVKSYWWGGWVGLLGGWVGGCGECGGLDGWPIYFLKMVHQVRLKMFSLKMVDYSMSLLSLST